MIWKSPFWIWQVHRSISTKHGCELSGKNGLVPSFGKGISAWILFQCYCQWRPHIPGRLFFEQPACWKMHGVNAFLQDPWIFRSKPSWFCLIWREKQMREHQNGSNSCPSCIHSEASVEFLRAQVASQLWVCVNILWLVSISKAFYKVVAELSKVAQLCVFILGSSTFTLYLCMRLGLGMWYTYSSSGAALESVPWGLNR